ncbi:MAG: hypothetical protein Q9191_001587 [Dirinaria sp. TL-2023a]
MAGTRSSARQAAAAAASSSPNSSQSKQGSDGGAAGSKRKAGAGASPKAKRGKKGDKKEQATLEETMPRDETGTKDGVEIEDATEPKQEAAEEKGVNEKAQNGKETSEHDQGPEVDNTANVEYTSQNGGQSAVETNEKSAVETSTQREESTPSSILEKGIIYFFERGRVGVDEPSNPDEIARSYIVLRPMPHGAKLGEGPIGDEGQNRLLALPKKVLPKSPKDRFMTFVEKAKVGLEDLRASMGSSDYATKTAGTRHTPAMAPLAEGVYAITSTGRESHLAYILTIPSEVTEVQLDIGLQQRGSFVTSVKNPSYSGPANANLPKGPEYPQELLDEFRSLRWMPLQPKHLDYENTQLLLIGHKEQALEKAAGQQNQDEGDGKDQPIEEMEKLEHEDEIRVEHLKGDDTVFVDLGLSSKDYPKVQTTW